MIIHLSLYNQYYIKRQESILEYLTRILKANPYNAKQVQVNGIKAFLQIEESFLYAMEGNVDYGENNSQLFNNLAMIYPNLHASLQHMHSFLEMGTINFKPYLWLLLMIRALFCLSLRQKISCIFL